MICCKECLDLLYDYLDGNLDQEATKELDEHFEDCPPCISFLNTYKSTTELARENLGKIEIPEAVQSRLLDYLKEHTRKQ
jgi:anti-sigma factor (TIGR02949 family)